MQKKTNSSYAGKFQLDLQAIVNHMPGHVYWQDKNGIILGCNDLQAKAFGFSVSAEAIGKCAYDFQTKRVARILKKNNLKVIKSGKEILVEEPLELPDGRVNFFLSQKVPLYDSQGDIVGLLGISLDITENKIRNQEDQLLFKRILSLIPGHIYWKDINCKFLGCNDEQAKAAGLNSVQEIIGKSAYDIITNAQSDIERKKQAKAIDDVDQGIIRTGVEETLEEPLVLSDGTIKTYISHKVPLRNQEGKIIGIIGTSIDITEQKKIKEALRKAQGQADGMALVSASIAHELRTPLASMKSAMHSINAYLPKLIQTYYQALTHKLDVPPLNEKILQSLQESTANINKKVDHANMVIDMLLTNLAHNQISVADFTECAIADCVEQAIEKYPFMTGQKKLIKNNIKNNFSFQGKSILIVHILFNLLKNALYFIQKAGKGEIQIWTELGETNSLHFKDTSQGIPPEILPHIFDQFFSQGTNHGTGIGLAFSKMVMQAHQGEITCQSVYGEYTEFTLTLPQFLNERK